MSVDLSKQLNKEKDDLLEAYREYRETAQILIDAQKKQIEHLKKQNEQYREMLKTSMEQTDRVLGLTRRSLN